MALGFTGPELAAGEVATVAVKTEPERRPESIKGWEGHWVALRDGEVIAAAWSPRELVATLHEMGPAATGAVARYIPRPSSDIVIGVG